MEILQHAHSGLRWLVLISLMLAIINAIIKTRGSKTFTASDKKLSLFALIFTHLQLVLGLVLYSISPKVVFAASSMSDRVLRFFLVEHISLMLVAIILITIGYSKSKRALSDSKRFRYILIFYAIGLILILAGIPWPFQNYGAGWS